MKVKKQATVKWIFYMLILCVVFLVQTGYPSPFNIGRNVCLFPFLVVSTAIYEQPFAAAVFGFVTGMFADAASAAPDGILMAFYTILGVSAGIISERYFRRTLRVCFVIGGAALLFQRIVGYVFYYSFAFGINIRQAVGVIIGELFLSLPFAVVIYFAVKTIHRCFMKSEDE